jgi:alpha-N-acetylglucosamine transferase
MKRIERVLFKLIIFQLVCLLLSQFILTIPNLSVYLTKIELYEGVTQKAKDVTREVYNHIGK